MSTNIYRRLLELLPDTPITTGQVLVAYDDGTALVSTFGGGQMRVRNPLDLAVDQYAYVQDGAVIGEAPTLTEVLIEI